MAIQIEGGGGGAVKIGSNAASGGGTSTEVVSAAANTNGILICTLSIQTSSSSGEIQARAGATTFAKTEYANALFASNIIIPAGVSLYMFCGSQNNVVVDSYYLTYEVL